jgi:cell division protein FtsL
MPRKVLYRILALFVFVVAISVGVIYFTFDKRALEYLTMFKPWSVGLALLCLAIGLFFDAMRLVTLTKITG